MSFRCGWACLVIAVAAAARGAEGGTAAEVTRSRGLATLGKLDEALAAADAAVAADRTDRSALLQRAWVLGLMGRRQECDGAYQSLVNAMPNDAGPFFQHGMVAFNNRNYFSAITDFTRALVRNQGLAEAGLRRAEAAILVGHEAMAAGDLTHVIAVDEKNAEAYAWRAYVNRRIGKGADANADLAKANEIAVGEKQHWASIAEGSGFPATTRKQGTAVAPLDCPEREEARKLKKDFAPLYMERAENIMAQGREDDADLAMGKKLDPKGYDAMRTSIDRDLQSFRRQIAAEKAAAAEWAQIWAAMARADHQARMGRANAADASGNHDLARVIREGG